MSRRSHGLRAWIIQRISAIYMVAYLVYFLIHLIINPPHSYQDWHGWLTGSAVGIGTALFFIALLIHAWVGVRDVIMDYVKPLALRFSFLSLLGLMLLACGLWVLRILILVSR